jgi:molybdenum cofactor cytidylyltransferase
MISGIILAGGQSSRIGQPKALLSIGPETFSECIANKMKRAGVDQVYLITGVDDQKIKDALKDKIPAEIIFNERSKGGQISSLKAGIRCISPESDGVLVWPVDLPLIKVQTVSKILKSFQSNQKAIVIPTHKERRGHPIVIGRELMTDLLRLPSEHTTRDFLASHATNVLEIDLDDPAILIDIDTPEDYAKYVVR